MSDVKARLLNGDLQLQGEVNERLPSVTDGLIAHFPFDGVEQRYYPHKIRYIRDWLNGSTSNTGDHWVEIQAMDYSGNNVALNKTAYGSEGSSSTWHRVTDGDTNTSNYTYVSSLTNCYMEIDLEELYLLKEIKVWHYYGDGRTYHNTKTEVSEDGIHWFPIFDSAIEGEYAETSAGKTHDLMNLGTTVKPSANTSTTLTSEGIAVEEGTTNLVNSPEFTSTSLGGNWGSWDGNVLTFDKAFLLEKETNVINLTKQTDGSANAIHQNIGGLTLDNDYTLSFYIRIHPKSNIESGYIKAYIHSSYSNHPITKEWTRITHTNTSIRDNHTIHIRQYSTLYDVQITMVQFEQKPFATSFVNGSRSAIGDLILSTNLGLNDFTIVGEFIPNSNSDNPDYGGHLSSGSLLFRLEDTVSTDVDFRSYKNVPYIDGNAFDGSNHNIHEDFNTLPNIKVKYSMKRQGNTLWLRMIGEDGQDTTWRIPRDPATDNGLGSFNFDNFRIYGYWGGTHKNVSIYDRLLTDQEIQKLHNPSLQLTQEGNIISSELIEEPNDISSDIIYFPLGADGEDKYKTIKPREETCTTYVDGGVWIGRGTTNLWTTNKLEAHGSKIELLEDIMYKNRPIYKNTVTNAEVGNNFGIKLSSGITINGSAITFTLSVPYNVQYYANLNGLNMGGYVRVYYTDGTYDSFSFTSKVVDCKNSVNWNKWHELVHTFTTSSTKTVSNISNAYFYTDYAKANSEILFGHPQLEQKSYATPFTSGTREYTRLNYDSNLLNNANDWQEFTVLYWAKYPAWTGWSISGDWSKFYLGVNSGAYQRFSWVENGSQKVVDTSGFPLTLNKWHMQGYSIKNNEFIDIYLDGKRVRNWVSTFQLNSTGFNNIFEWNSIDYTSTSYPLNAYLKDAMIVPRAMTPEEISKIYETQMRQLNGIQIQGRLLEDEVLI